MATQTPNIPFPSSQTEETPTREQIAVVRVIYRLWRVDTAARSFPYDMKDELSLMRARWSIGLVQELVCVCVTPLQIISAHPLHGSSKAFATPWAMRVLWAI